MTASGIEPATLRFVVQRLNHCATVRSPVFKSNEGKTRDRFGKEKFGEESRTQILLITLKEKGLHWFADIIRMAETWILGRAIK